MNPKTPRFAQRLQALGQHARRLRQVVEAAPAQAAELRNTVTLTAAQLQQLRAEVQAGIADLRADTGDHVLASLAELEAHRGVLEDAGYRLEGVDLELGAASTQRLFLRLRRVEDVPIDTLRALLAAHGSRPALRGVLGALLRCAELAGRVALAELDLRDLVIQFGPAPTLRAGWRRLESLAPVPDRADPPEAPETPPVPPVLTPAPAAPPPSAPAPQSRPMESVLTPASRVPDPAPAVSVAPVPAPAQGPASTPDPTPTVSPVTSKPWLTPIAPSLGKDWRRNALDRFKKMPDRS